jgi:hypothetical protein
MYHIFVMLEENTPRIIPVHLAIVKKNGALPHQILEKLA